MNITKIILNGCWGGYGWSDKALAEINKRSDVTYRSSYDVPRRDPIAIAVLEEFGSEFCSGPSSRLRIEEYDADLFEGYINDYDGQESLDLVPSLSESRIRSCKSMDEVVELLRLANVIRQPEPKPEPPRVYSADEYERVYSDEPDEYDSYMPKHQKKVTA